MKKPPVRVHHQQLSLWQSMVKETTEKLYPDNPGFVEKLLDANDAFVTKVSQIDGYPLTSPALYEASYPENGTAFENLSKNNLIALLESHYTSMYMKSRGGVELATTDDYRPYSDDPWQIWVQKCGEAYAIAFYNYDGVRDYVNYPKSQISTFGVIDWELPQGSKVAIIGDWGTGMEDSAYLLNDIITQHSPAAIIHLGDVYYAGTTAETASNFVNVINQVFTDTGVSIPVFTIPGNHEYYSLAYPYFAALPGLNSAVGSSCLQQASYFCLRVQDSQWQFLAMDTGYNDSDPLNAKDSFVEGPHIRSNEREWHKDKMDNFDGTTILLSHHQLFSANAKINGSTSWDGIWHTEYMNMGLYNTFKSYFKNKIACWIWGHEHNFAVYQNNLEGLSKGRLLGCSAYEEETGLNPYTVNCDDYPYLTDSGHPNGYQVSNKGGYYNHAYAVLDFSNCQSANDQVVARYYEYPSWDGNNIPTNPAPASSALYAENLSRPSNLQQPKVNFGDLIKLSCTKNNKMAFLSGADGSYNALLQNYAENLQIMPAAGQSGDIDDADTVYIINKNPLLSGKKYLCANGTSGDLYYSNTQSAEAIWQIRDSSESSGGSVRRGDTVYFKSNTHSGYYLSSNSSNILTLSSSSGNRINFVINPGVSIPTSEPFPSGSPVRLAVAYQNEWYYVAESGVFQSMNGARLISMHDIIASGGAGSVELGLQDITNGGISTYSYNGRTYNVPRLLSDGDACNLETISGAGLGVDGGLYLREMGSGWPLVYLTGAGPGGEFTVTKANGGTGEIHQNDLLYFASNQNVGNYMGVVLESDGYLYLGLSTTPVYCKLDYQEAY